jgi:hypothetical protein
MAQPIHVSEIPFPKPRTPEQADAFAHVDLVFHDQHGDSLKWTEFEWTAYHRAISHALGLDADA